MTTQQLNPRATVYLTSPRNWDNWFPVAKAYGLALEIWDYMNPDTEERVLPTEPPIPPFSQVKADATTILDLKEDELTRYNYLFKVWRKKKDAFRKTEQGLALFNYHLISTVNGSMLAYLIKNEDSLYGIMKALKKEYTFPPRTSFAAMLQRQTQPPPEEKSTIEPYKGHREDNGCPSPCGQHSSWSKCFYLNPAIQPANVNENSQV